MFSVSIPRRVAIRWPIIAACVAAIAVFSPLFGEATDAATNASSTNAPAATPPAPAPFALGDVMVQVQAATTDLQQQKASLDPDPVLEVVADKLPNLSRRIQDRTTEDTALLDGSTSLAPVQISGGAWQSLVDELADAQKALSARVGVLNNLLYKLSLMDGRWKATQGLKDVPPEIAQHIKDVRAQIAETTKAVNAHLEPLYLMQQRVATQDKLAETSLAAINKAIDKALDDLFQRNHPPLWDSQSFTFSKVGVVTNEERSFESQVDGMKTYLAQKVGVAILHLFLLALLVMTIYWVRNAIHARAEEDIELRKSAQIFNDPFPTALLLALLVTGFFYPHAARLLYAIAGGLALIPAVIITRRLIDPVNVPILYAAVIAFLIDQVRFVASPDGVLSRLVFIIELTAICLFILFMLRSRHMTPTSTETAQLRRLSRIYLHVTFVVLLGAGFANVFGYIPLSILVGNGMLTSSYFAILLYPAVRILDALALASLSMEPISRLGMVRHHRELIYKNVGIAIRWIIFAIWFISALEFFRLRSPVLNGAKNLLWDERLPYFALNVSLGAILAFPITIWASFLISRFVRFLLKEEVYPQMQLGRGIPYAASTMVHYTILCIGFFAAVAATGVELSQFAFLAGAFGVGLGFGLQNIMNNFVSGIILLFERPIKVGDDIQIDANTIGRVERIGIRASVILLTNGSEMIVPNGNLISNPVTNWTLSNCERLIEIPVNVTSKEDPQKIIDILLATARANANVLKNPPPQALLVNLVGAALGFKLRAWIDSEDKWVQITSDLSLAVNAALAKENITIG
jgi:small-conductance mechanosensitive channel